MIVISMDWPTAIGAACSLAIVVGALLEYFRSRTPRSWYHDLEHRVSDVERRVGDLENPKSKRRR